MLATPTTNNAASSRRTRALAMAAAQPVTPHTATALQYQWTQLTPTAEPTDAELKLTTSRLSISAVPEDEDEEGDADEEEEEEEKEEQHEPELPPWQATTDLPHRRVMVQRILTLIEKRTRPANNVPVPAEEAPEVQERALEATPVETAETNQQVERRAHGVATSVSVTEGPTALAKRIELSLYSRAGSLEEYKNTATLRRRLQSLVSLSFHEAAATKDETNGMVVVVARRQTTGSKRPRQVAGTFSCASLSSSKHRRLSLVHYSSSKSSSSSSGRVLGSLSDDCLRTVFSFLDGRHVITLRCLNQFAADFLPSCVVSLEIEVAQLHHHFTRDPEYAMVRRMTNLARLVVFKSANPCLTPTSASAGQKLALHAWGCAELDVSHNNIGELAMQHLANALDMGAGSRLRELQLVSTFSNTNRRNGARALCLALSRGSCPLLEHLLLGGNSITDAGAGDVARLLESKALPQLKRLDLRRNYIGECGLRRLMVALVGAAAPLEKLQYLCMGGNLITDNCVLSLTDVLAQSTCPRMRFLGLEDNFLSPEGVQTIIQAAVSGGMAPKLHRVSNDGAIMTE